MRCLEQTQKSLHLNRTRRYQIRTDLSHIYADKAPVIRGCTGFDGDLEIMEAIDGPGPSKNLELNINADNKLAYAA